MNYLNEIDLKKAEKHNQKLYKYYKMISWDLLFYYAISFLFLHETKGLSTSEILFADAFYPIFKIILQLPVTILIEKIGKKRSLMIGNLSLSAFFVIVMILSSKYYLILANVFCAFGFITKNITQSNLLFDSIRSSNESHILYSKIDGKGSSLYFAFDAITSIITGFLFVINPYIPILLGFIFTILSFILSCQFIDIAYINNKNQKNNNENKSIKNEFKEYLLDLAKSFKLIVKSKRLRALILFYTVFLTLLEITVTIRQSLLAEIQIPDKYFGVLFAIWGLILAFSASSAPRIQKRYGNHALSVLGLTFTISLIFTGVVSNSAGLSKFLIYFIVLSLISIQYTVKGPFHTLIDRYLGSFTTSKMQTRISSVSIFIESINRAFVLFLLSYITNNFSSSMSILIIGIAFTIVLILIIKYMKGKVGLKPEEYPKSDTCLNFVK